MSSNFYTVIGGSGDLATRLGNPGTGKTLISLIDGSSTTIKSALDQVSNNLVGNNNYTNSINSNLSTIISNLDNIPFTLPGVTVVTVSSITNSNGIISMVTDAGTFSINTFSISINNGNTFTLTSTGNELILYNMSGSLIGNASAMEVYLKSIFPQNSTISKITTNIISSISKMIGGTTSNIRSEMGKIDSIILKNPTGVIKTDLTSLRSLIKVPIGTTIEDDIRDILGAIDNTIDDTSDVSSLPVKSISDDSSGGVTITLEDLSDSQIQETYNLSGAIITNASSTGGGISNNSTMSFVGSTKTLVLINKSGVKLNSQTDYLYYLNLVYPVGSVITRNSTDRVASIRTQIGVNTSSLKTDIGTINKSILVSPTGILNADLGTLRNLVIPNADQESIFEKDIRAINKLLNGTETGSTVKERIGAPIVNGTPSSVSAIIGGTAGSDIAVRLGDPGVSGSTGLSALINVKKAITNPSNSGIDIFDSTAFGNFTNATDINTQLTKFIELFKSSGWSNKGNTKITFDFSSGGPSSLADIIAAASVTSS